MIRFPRKVTPVVVLGIDEQYSLELQGGRDKLRLWAWRQSLKAPPQFLDLTYEQDMATEALRWLDARGHVLPSYHLARLVESLERPQESTRRAA